MHTGIQYRFGRLHEDGSTEQKKAEFFIDAAFFVSAPDIVL